MFGCPPPGQRSHPSPCVSRGVERAGERAGRLCSPGPGDRTGEMRTLSLLAAAAAGAWAGWRVARRVPAGLLGPTRAGPQPAAGFLDAVRAREVPVSLEKLMALVELGRERGLEVIQSVLGGRTDHAA